MKRGGLGTYNEVVTPRDTDDDSLRGISGPFGGQYHLEIFLRLWVQGKVGDLF